MTSRWMFFPSPPATGVKMQLDAELVATGNARAFNMTNASLTGSDDVANNYTLYTISPFRTNAARTYVEWIFKVDASGDYATTGDWETAVTNAGGINIASSDWTHDGVTLNATSISYTLGPDTSTIVRVRFVGSNSDVDAFWNSFGTGDSTQIKLNW